MIIASDNNNYCLLNNFIASEIYVITNEKSDLHSRVIINLMKSNYKFFFSCNIVMH